MSGEDLTFFSSHGSDPTQMIHPIRAKQNDCYQNLPHFCANYRTSRHNGGLFTYCPSATVALCHHQSPPSKGTHLGQQSPVILGWQVLHCYPVLLGPRLNLLRSSLQDSHRFPSADWIKCLLSLNSSMIPLLKATVPSEHFLRPNLHHGLRSAPNVDVLLPRLLSSPGHQRRLPQPSLNP